MTKEEIEYSVRKAMKNSASQEEQGRLYWAVQNFMKESTHDLNWSIIEIVTMMYRSKE